MIESTTVHKFSLVIMKVFSYDFGVPGIVHFPSFEVPLEPYLNEGRYCNKQIPLQLRILKVFTSCFTLLEKRSPWKILYFFQKNSLWTATHEGNRERARGSDLKQRRWILLEEIKTWKIDRGGKKMRNAIGLQQGENKRHWKN